MWFVKYGNEYLHDPRVGVLLTASKPSVELNTSTTFEFQITFDHPLYNKIRERDLENSVVVYQDDTIIYKGEIVEIDKDFQLTKTVTCKSDLGFFNSAIVRPYSTYQGECSRQAPATVDGYFDFLIDEYNRQASETRKFKKGINEGCYLEWDNYIYRADTTYPTVGSVIKEKIIDSLGGYIRTRYEEDGTYIDLLRDMPDVNAQIIDFGVNLLDYVEEETSDDVISFVVPIGKEIENVEENSSRLPVKLTISSQSVPYLKKVVDKRQAELDEITAEENPDPERVQKAKDAYDEANEAYKNCKSASVDRLIEEGYYKSGDIIYSTKAVTRYGWIGSVAEYSDVTLTSNLVTRGLLSLKASESPIKTLTLTALDLSMINPNLRPIKLGDYIRVRSKPHNVDSYFLCTKIEYDLNNPGNNTFTLGTTFDTLTGQQNRRINALNATINTVYEAAEKISVEAKVASKIAREAMSTVANISGKFIHIMYSENSDGSEMTDTPGDTTKYIGIYSGDSETAPTDATLYSWSRIRGNDGVGVKGEDGSSAYLHIKYSNDGQTFTENNGETPGDWIGTYTDDIKADSTSFEKYTWKKIKGEQGNGITSTTITYQAGSSATVIPTGTWLDTVPTTDADNPYLWTKTYIEYTDGTCSTSYSVSSNIDSVKDDITEAAKTATNYMNYVEGTGLIVGNMTDETLGKNLLINSESVKIREDQTDLASFMANEVNLAKNTFKITQNDNKTNIIGLPPSVTTEEAGHVVVTFKPDSELNGQTPTEILDSISYVTSYSLISDRSYDVYFEPRVPVESFIHYLLRTGFVENAQSCTTTEQSNFSEMNIGVGHGSSMIYLLAYKNGDNAMSLTAKDLYLSAKSIKIDGQTLVSINIPVLPTADCNNLVQSGKYYIGNQSTNKPIVYNGWLEVMSYAKNTYQLYTPYDSSLGDIYERWRVNGTWGDWKKQGLENNHVLWTGEYFMHGTQSINLSEAITSQKNGIVLVWSAYSGGAAQNSGWHYFFVPKRHVISHNGDGVRCTDAFYGMNKYLYISDKIISGNAQNIQSGTYNGISYDNTNHVLREVLGV